MTVSDGHGQAPGGGSIPSTAVTLGILAGGRATRLGGIDKAWVVRGGVPQVLRWRARFAAEVDACLVSANASFEAYARHGLSVVGDRESGLGPLSGLDALAAACVTPWLFTLPVDLIGTNDCLLRTLISSRDKDGAWAADDDGPQPLVALWHCDALRGAVSAAIAAGEWPVHRLQSRLQMRCATFSGFRFGNLNTPDDLRAAGATAQGGSA